VILAASRRAVPVQSRGRHDAHPNDPPNPRNPELSMKKNFSALALAALAALLAASGAAHAQTPSGGMVVKESAPGKVTLADAVRLVATVQAVDKAKRLVTLKSASGEVMIVQASAEVKNFDQIKVGDEVVARYVQALSLELKKGGAGGIREKVEDEGAVAAKPGEKPGAAVGRTVRATADVIAVDAKTQTIRLRGPERTVDLRVKDPAQFKLVKVGDQVEAKFVEALAVSVEAAPKK
jgi:Cu/Ag efflux protein CusF